MTSRILATVLCLLAFVTDANPLNQWQWQYRVLLIKQADERALPQILQFYQQQQVEFIDRRMLLVEIQNNAVRCFPSVCEDIDASKFHLKDMPIETMLLIGLDGSKKAAYPAQMSSFEEVFRDIDQMPMRRAQRN